MTEVGSILKLSIERVTAEPKAAPHFKKAEPSSPLGIFDSGVGGLTVLSEVMSHLPNEDVIYLADTAHVPFGSRPVEEIIEINREILDFFARQGVKLAIMACGTSSSLAYPKFKDKYHFPIVSIIEPGASAALAATHNKRIGLIATQNTVNSQAFQDLIIEKDKKAVVYASACPLFVPLIEGGFIEAEETKKVAEEYLLPLIKQKVDTLILGCTHYPHLSKVLSGIIEARLINPALGAADEAKEILKKTHMLKSGSAGARYVYYTTASPIQFELLGSKLMRKPIVGVKLVKLT